MMFILYFDGQHHEYYHGTFEQKGWLNYPLRPGESFWLVPGTYPEDYSDIAVDDDENQGDENDETLEYMCELLEAGEVEPSEFRRQLCGEGYDSETIRIAILNHAPAQAVVLGW